MEEDRLEEIKKKHGTAKEIVTNMDTPGRFIREEWIDWLIQEVERLQDSELWKEKVKLLEQNESLREERDGLKKQAEIGYWKTEYTALSKEYDKELRKCTDLMAENAQLKEPPEICSGCGRKGIHEYCGPITYKEKNEENQ